MKINRILGKQGRITIPYEMRLKLGFQFNDGISFEQQDNNPLIIHREKLCDGNNSADASIRTHERALLNFLDGLSTAEQKTAFLHLSKKWASFSGGR